MRHTASIVLATTFAASAATGHPGHGQQGEAFGLVHYLTEPLHVVGALAVVLVALTGLRVLQGRRAAPVRKG